MGRYSRSILVPYLEDICALHLEKKRLGQNISKLNQDIDQIRKKAEQISEPMAENNVESAGGGIFLLQTGGVLFGIGLIPLLWGSAGLIKFAFFVLITGGVFFLLEKNDVEQKNRAINEHNRERWNWHYKRLEESRERAEIQCKPILDQVSKMNQEITAVEDLLEGLYAVNVIPSQYRNLYSAVYLYDWFSTSQMDDLESALNIFVLEQIKSRLDTIIQNQQTMILNQRIMIANQYRAAEQRERHAAMLRDEMEKITRSNEERNMYLGMINANTATTAYFAQKTYKGNN